VVRPNDKAAYRAGVGHDLAFDVGVLCVQVPVYRDAERRVGPEGSASPHAVAHVLRIHSYDVVAAAQLYPAVAVEHGVIILNCEIADRPAAKLARRGWGHSAQYGHEVAGSHPTALLLAHEIHDHSGVALGRAVDGRYFQPDGSDPLRCDLNSRRENV